MGFGGWSPIEREALVRTIVSGGGAMLLAYAWFVWATDRASMLQVRGLAISGVGFLVSAAASVYLRDRTIVGPVVSFAGAVVVLVGMRILLRERIERQDAARRHGARRPSGD